MHTVFLLTFLCTTRNVTYPHYAFWLATNGLLIDHGGNSVRQPVKFVNIPLMSEVISLRLCFMTCNLIPFNYLWPGIYYLHSGRLGRVATIPQPRVIVALSVYDGFYATQNMLCSSWQSCMKSVMQTFVFVSLTNLFRICATILLPPTLPLFNWYGVRLKLERQTDNRNTMVQLYQVKCVTKEMWFTLEVWFTDHTVGILKAMYY